MTPATVDERERPRRIVKRCAEMLKGFPSLHSLVRDDPRGTFEREATEFLERAASDEQALAMKPEELDEAIALHMKFLLLTAEMNRLQKGK